MIGVPGQACFNRGAAWNVGILHARNEWVMCMDCDVRFIEDPLAESMLNLANSNNFYRVQADWNLDTEHAPSPESLWTLHHQQVSMGHGQRLPGMPEIRLGMGGRRFLSEASQCQAARSVPAL